MGARSPSSESSESANVPLKANGAKLTVVATFPPGFFLENIAGSARSGYYVTCMNRKELYWIPTPDAKNDRLVSPYLLETYPGQERPMGVLQAPRDNNVQYIATSDLIVSKGKPKSFLRVLDTTATAIQMQSEVITEFPADAKTLNGMCALSDNVLIVADSFASCIWRIDLIRAACGCSPASANNLSAQVTVWKSHHTMHAKLNPKDFQPGVNGLKYSARTGYAYYTSTQQRIFCRIRVDPNSLEAVGEPEVLAKGWQWDDLILDDRRGHDAVAYVTTHRDNSIVKILLDAGRLELGTEELKVVVQGGKDCMECIGPTAGVWLDGRVGKSALFTCDGGIKNRPDDGIVRPASIIRVDFDE